MDLIGFLIAVSDHRIGTAQRAFRQHSVQITHPSNTPRVCRQIIDRQGIIPRVRRFDVYRRYFLTALFFFFFLRISHAVATENDLPVIQYPLRIQHADRADTRHSRIASGTEVFQYPPAGISLHHALLTEEYSVSPILHLDPERLYISLIDQ